MGSTVSTLIHLEGFGLFFTPLPRELVRQFLVISSGQTEEERKQPSNQVFIELGEFYSLLGEDPSLVPTEPRKFPSIRDAITYLRELAREDEEARLRINEIDSSGDGKLSSLRLRLEYFAVVLRVRPDFVWVASPN